MDEAVEKNQKAEKGTPKGFTRANPNRQVTRTRSPNHVSIYSNNVEVGVSAWDVRIKLGEIVEANDNRLDISILATLFMSPPHAKAFSKVLAENIKKYEAAMGEIPMPPENPR